MAKPQFRVRFDVPHDFCIEPGYFRTPHAHDFRSETGTHSDTWRDPITGLVMLKPSFLWENWHIHNKPLSQWTKNAAYWQESYRAKESGGSPGLMTTVSPAGGAYPLIDILRTDALMIISSAITDDSLVWALESDFTLADDEGFVIQYRAMTDEMRRHRNWFGVQVDNLFLHFSLDGVVRVSRYDRADFTVAPVPFAEFEIASPGELANSDGYFAIIPIPGYGLAFYHKQAPQRSRSRSSSGQAGAVRGHLIELPSEDDGSGDLRLTRSSKVAVAFNASGEMHHKFGFHTIRYPATGTFLGSIFDPKYQPANAPNVVQPICIDTHTTAATATSVLRKRDDSGNWTAGTDRFGRVKTTLATTDTRYTPFLFGEYVAWESVRATRNTTPVEPDRLLHLSFSDDDLGRFEGTCKVLMEGEAQRKLVERGDATFVLEKSLDGGETWTVHNGGLARVAGDVEVHYDQAGMYYLASWTLKDKSARFSEVVQHLENAFDGMTVGEAINVALYCSGEPPVSPLPAEAQAIRLPKLPRGQSWRFAPRAGDDGEKIIRSLLLFLRTERVEWRLRYDWEAGEWLLEQKPRSVAAEDLWTLTPFDDEVSAASRILRLGQGSELLFTFTPQPPEANQMVPFGLTSTDANTATRVQGPFFRNVPSLNDPNSPEYLGRVIPAYPMFSPISDKATITEMGRRVFAASCHRRLLPVVPGPDYVDGFTPGKRVKVRGVDHEGNRIELFTDDAEEQYLWLKRRTVTLDLQAEGEIAPDVRYHLDSVWETPIE